MRLDINPAVHANSGTHVSQSVFTGSIGLGPFLCIVCLWLLFLTTSSEVDIDESSFYSHRWGLLSGGCGMLSAWECLPAGWRT